MPLGMDVDLGPGNIVLDGKPAPPWKGAFRVVVALLSATEASHLSGSQGVDEVGRARCVRGIAAWVTLPPAVPRPRQDATAIAKHQQTCLYPHSQWWLQQ